MILGLQIGQMMASKVEERFSWRHPVVDENKYLWLTYPWKSLENVICKISEDVSELLKKFFISWQVFVPSIHVFTDESLKQFLQSLVNISRNKNMIRFNPGAPLSLGSNVTPGIVTQALSSPGHWWWEVECDDAERTEEDEAREAEDEAEENNEEDSETACLQ